MNIGIYFNGKVYHRTHQVHGLTGGDWENGWSGIMTTGGLEVYNIINRHEWWVESCQEVMFEILNGDAYVKKIGELKPYEYAKQYCTNCLEF